MLTLPDAIVSILAPFATVFTNPTWRKAQLLLVGAILTTGQRTVAAALRVMGRSDQDDYARYHEVLNRAVWSPREAARILLLLLILPIGILLIRDRPEDKGLRPFGSGDNLSVGAGRRRGGDVNFSFMDAIRTSMFQKLTFGYFV